MILRPFSLKKIEKSISTLSPKGAIKPTYIRFKANREKTSRGQKSLCSIDTYRQSSSLGSKRMLSHRKLISAYSIDQKQNLTERKCPNDTERERKKTVQSQNNNNIDYANRNGLKNDSKKKFHLNKFSQFRNDRLHTIQNQESQNIEKVLEIKENILKEFIDRFQEELKQISQQKSSRQTLVTHRMKTQSQKQETTKKPRTLLNSLQSNRQTLNISKCLKKEKQNLFPMPSLQNLEKAKFQQYIKQIKDIKKKDQKIFIMKNHKKSLQNISISKIGSTENVTSRVAKIQTKNKLNLKQLFRHSKKYEPYLRDSQTLTINPLPLLQTGKIEQQKMQQKLCLKQHNQSMNPSVQIDCSSIQKMNQSSFISDFGRKSLLKHLENQSVKIMKDEQRKTKKCLAKMKSIFPSDFF